MREESSAVMPPPLYPQCIEVDLVVILSLLQDLQVLFNYWSTKGMRCVCVCVCALSIWCGLSRKQKYQWFLKFACVLLDWIYALSSFCSVSGIVDVWLWVIFFHDILLLVPVLNLSLKTDKRELKRVLFLYITPS